MNAAKALYQAAWREVRQAAHIQQSLPGLTIWQITTIVRQTEVGTAAYFSHCARQGFRERAEEDVRFLVAMVLHRHPNDVYNAYFPPQTHIFKQVLQ